MIEKDPDHRGPFSQKGWVRGARGHVELGKDGAGDFKYKDGDGPDVRAALPDHRQAAAACDDGRFFTLGADKLPGARGFGEPLRNTLDIDASARCWSR